ncbi:MAG: BspA family leucine-rich repeat surface protein [Bacteroidales bacterium]|nr:BspA family leucine-rich repeat surface protein [Bacteroidales bacterium]
MYTVRLENTVTHQIYEQQVEDTNDGGKLYFRFGISTIDLADGEYILTVFGENGDVLAEDLLRIGDFNPQTLQYTKGEKTYLDITVDAILQREKNVSITDIHTRILPDLGNDAVEIVYVDAQPLYDSARSEGYDEGYGIGQSEGYPNGYADGYNKGTEDGYNTGSAEAYPRGYEDGYDSGRTDGYNEGYDVGSMDMHLEMLEETRILNVTENGRYFTKYTEDPYIPTGDGDFSDFCKLTNTTYQMGRLKSYNEVQETGSDVIEFWWRPKDLAYNHRPMILMSSAENDGNGIHHTFSINLLTYDREDKLRFRSDAGGGTFVEHIISSGPEMWYHILIQNSELYINDEFISNFYIVNDNETSYIYLNGDTRTDVEDGIDECNGYFGMVKINGEVFIPTENGYMDQNTGNIIQPIEGGEYEYLRQRDPEGGLYRTVNVNIDTKQYFLEGYDEGYSTGYNVGEQASFGNGYEQGQKDIAENARVLEVTENGLYVSKFSEIPKPDVVTGFYPDGTEFYNYTVLEGKIFDTKIPATSASTLEIWYKGDGIKVGDAYNVIIGAGKSDDSSCYQIRYDVNSNKTVRYQVGYASKAYTWDEDVWHHIMIKYKEGSSLLYLWVDDVQVVSFGNIVFDTQSTFYINGVEYDTSGGRTANGCFGMIKIDGTTIIPTKDGFLNTNTGELLDVIQGGGYEFVNNTVIPEGEMYKTVKVNVAQSVKFSRYGMKCAYSTFQYLPNWIDLNNMVDCSYLFTDSKIIEAPYFDTSNATTMYRMFSNCFDLTTIPIYDTKKVTDFSGIFNNASALKTIPAFEIGRGANIKEYVYNCRNLTSFPAIDTSGAVNMQSMFYGCTSLTEIPALDASSIDVGAYNSASIFGYNELPKLTKAGGLLNLRKKIDDSYGWSKCPNLDRESCINILNGLYDFVGNGETPNSNEGKLKVHQNFLNAVGDDITIGTNKGWTITT